MTTIRPARADERAALVELQRRASLANPGDRDAMLAHPEAVDTPAGQFEAGQVFLAEDAGVVLGFAAVIPRADGEAELDALFVEPGLWRSGVGRALVAHAAANAKGSSVLHVIGNPHAADFYRAVGFVETGSFDTQFGRGILFELAL
ncbi:MAG: GNAT family N-acetyltransferase [Rhodoglobus sp.]